MQSKAELIAALDATKTITLTTHRRDGRPVTTPVNIAFDDGHAYFRTWDTSGKAKRMRNDADVEVAPAVFSGRKATGPEFEAHARLLEGEEDARARHALRHRFPFLHGVFVPLAHKVQRTRTVHYELEPKGADQADNARG
jgi:PPOX class probable F420-dependent enzyme